MVFDVCFDVLSTRSVYISHVMFSSATAGRNCAELIGRLAADWRSRKSRNLINDRRRAKDAFIAHILSEPCFSQLFYHLVSALRTLYLSFSSPHFHLQVVISDKIIIFTQSLPIQFNPGPTSRLNILPSHCTHKQPSSLSMFYLDILSLQPSISRGRVVYARAG